MAWLSGFATATATATAITITIAVVLAGDSAARELRPSDHGLVFQASPPANSSLQMRSFFNTKGSSSPDVSLPNGTNSTESLPPSWWRATPGDGGGGGRHWGGALMVASVACGITGVVLLVASGLLYLFKHRTKPNLNESFRGDHNNSVNNNANKLQLVPVGRNR